MQLLVTGGGTGGHVYPALEVAEHARSCGATVSYLGSLRGIEGDECRKRDMPFVGLNTGPLWHLLTPRGWVALAGTLRAVTVARKHLLANRPDVVLSTGGYAAGPVLSAARTIGIPFVIHEQNTIPGRTHRLAARFARTACVVFDEAAGMFSCKTVRTGMPIRKDLIEAAARSSKDSRISTLIFGGSQGAAAINEAVLTLVMQHGSEGSWLHLTGPKLYEEVAKTAERLVSAPNYRIKGYLDGVEMADALSEASIAICRSGAGTVSELALFGVPAVFIPFPYAQADHQFHNAKAIEKIDGSIVMRQTEMTPQNLADAWARWAHDPGKRAQAGRRLREWAYPDATERVWKVIQEVAVAP